MNADDLRLANRYAELLRLIADFLTEYRESDNGGWAPVTEDDLDRFYDIICELIALKWSEDCDGDRPIEVDVTDRTRYHRLHYTPVPYTHDMEHGRDMKRLFESELFGRYQAAVTMNHNIAHGEMERYHQMLSDMARNTRKAKDIEKRRVKAEVEKIEAEKRGET